MKFTIIYYFLLNVLFVGADEFKSLDQATLKARLEKARELLKSVPLIDGHNDLAMNIQEKVNNQLSLFPFDKDITKLEPWASNPTSHTDLHMLREGMIGAQFWSAYVACGNPEENSVMEGIEQVDVIKRLILKYSKDMEFVDSHEGLLQAFAKGRIASLIGVEGGHMINSSLAVLRMFYNEGARYLTLTHTCNTPWAESSESEWKENSNVRGLSEFGKLVIGEMNRLGMIVDLSHVSSQTMQEVLQVTSAPVIFSHSSAREICNVTRNVPDEILKLMPQNGGVVMVNFYPKFVSCSEKATIHDVIRHINYIRNVSGVDHVGIGGDFDGIPLVPEGLENVSKYPYLFAELMVNPSWTNEDLKKLAGLNLLRVLKLVEEVRNDLNSEIPIEKRIPETEIHG